MAWQGSSGPNGVMQTPGGIFYDLGSGISNLTSTSILLSAYSFFPCFSFSLLYCLFSIFVHVFFHAALEHNTRTHMTLLMHSHYFLLVFFSPLNLAFTGTGKVVMAATVLHPFTECTGIEILNGLHCVAVELLSCFQDKVLPRMAKRERNTSMWCLLHFCVLKGREGVRVCVCISVYSCACACVCMCVCVVSNKIHFLLYFSCPSFAPSLPNSPLSPSLFTLMLLNSTPH